MVELNIVSKKEEKKELKKYRCRVCGWIYDPEKGEPSQNIPPGTPFEELPDSFRYSFRCPVCRGNVTKEYFEPVE
ncbi:rubredoxin [Methanocaldococcus indicus]|uniref:rubredoxin n=1 Tax=Methanocaldococcus indicus TaxID=213231 RepID=UPI003C6D2545